MSKRQRGAGIEWFSIIKNLELEDGDDGWGRLGKRCGIYVLGNQYVISSGLGPSPYQQTQTARLHPSGLKLVQLITLIHQLSFSSQSLYISMPVQLLAKEACPQEHQRPIDFRRKRRSLGSTWS